MKVWDHSNAFQGRLQNDYSVSDNGRGFGGLPPRKKKKYVTSKSSIFLRFKTMYAWQILAGRAPATLTPVSASASYTADCKQEKSRHMCMRGLH